MRAWLIGIGLLTALPTGTLQAAAQQGGVSEYHRALAHRMLSRVRVELERHYYDSTFGGRDLDAFEGKARIGIDDARTSAEVFGAVAQFLGDLGDSHTRFFPPGLTVEVDYGWDWAIVGEDCYVVAVDRGSDAERKGLRPGDRVLAMDGFRTGRQSMHLLEYVYHALRPRTSIALRVERPDGQREEIVFDAKVRRLPPNLSFDNLEHLRFLIDRSAVAGRIRHQWKTIDSVALWHFEAFGYRDDRLDQYMREARRYPWLILDLRGNGGGAIEAMSRLLGHFFDSTFAAYTQRTRDSMIEHRVTPRGGLSFRGQVVVLVDAQSASASEITSRVLQMRGRAMVVGDRTAGAVVTSIAFGLAEEASNQAVSYGMQVSVTDVIMPDGKRLEGVGVVPNVSALPTGSDIAAGRDPAMQFALELAGVRMSALDAGRIWR